MRGPEEGGAAGPDRLDEFVASGEQPERVDGHAAEVVADAEGDDVEYEPL